jgi:putative MATE family efflux protein
MTPTPTAKAPAGLFSKTFLSSLLSLALPISLQQTLTAALALVDVGMVGQLGELELGTVGLVAKFFFVSAHLLVGLASGTGVLAAQYFGRGNAQGGRQTLALSLALSTALTLPIALAAALFPQAIMSWIAADPAVQALGAEYLRITAPYHVLTGVVMAYAAGLRGMARPKLPMVAGLLGVALNTGLNYLLIFGHGPFPALGVAGAGYATVAARLAECLLLLAAVQARPHALRLSWADFRASFQPAFARRLLLPTLPIMGGECIWALGIFTYYVIYGHLGTRELATMSMLEPLEGLFIQFFLGFGTACGIMLGNELGAGRKEEAYAQARSFLLLLPFAGLVAGMAMIALRGPMLQLFPHLDPATRAMASDLFVIMGTALFIKIFNMLTMFGILRSGGDTRYMMRIDAFCMWGIGVPLAICGGMVLGLPLRWVYLLVLAEEAVKAVWSYRRVRSRKWLQTLVD